MILPRVDRAPDICERLIEMTTLNWESQDIEEESGAEIETSGSMVPVNKRVRRGTLRMPKECLRKIVGTYQILALGYEKLSQLLLAYPF